MAKADSPREVASTCYTGKVLSDGHLSLPSSVTKELRLQHGEEVEVVLRKADAAGPAVSSDIDSILEELIGPQSSRVTAIGKLTRAAKKMLASKKQRRLSHLLWENQGGTISAKEAKELDSLLAEEREGMVRKAKAIWALKQLGVDITT